MPFVYNRSGLVEDHECRHGYPSQACGVFVHGPVENLCAKVGLEMLRWYNSLPEQSHVRLGKIEYMRRDEVPGAEQSDFRPNLKRLAGL